MYNRPDSFRLKALEASTYCPKFSNDDVPVTQLEVDDFDVTKIKDKVKNNVDLLSYKKSHRLEIIEILDVLDRYRHIFLIDQQRYICFSWSGIPILRITVKKGTQTDRQLHISLQKYKSEKENQKMFYYVLGGTVLAGVALVVSLFVGGKGNNYRYGGKKNKNKKK